MQNKVRLEDEPAGQPTLPPSFIIIPGEVLTVAGGFSCGPVSSPFELLQSVDVFFYLTVSILSLLTLFTSLRFYYCYGLKGAIFD